MPSGTTWSTSNPMRVQLLEPGADLNARYARANGLHFYRETVLGRDIYSGESPDVICHELGHAILDALKPQLFHVASTEAGAFHESFGDMSAILCALQLPSVRAKVLEETEGRINVNSRLSRLAEQLGWGIRQLSPTTVDRDSLRNAANRFFYRPPDLLPPSAPANLLSKEVHSFSRVFTGAFLNALAGMFTATGAPHEANLSAVSRDMGQLLVDAVHAATVAPGYFAQVAAAMVQADRARFGGTYRSSLTRSFMERGILSVDSAMALESEPVPSVVGAQAAGMSATLEGASTVLAYEGAQDDDAYSLGLG
ncbi:M36 family metallopeptidase, partial [Rhizobiaceae sp. 2RAB30]